MTIALGTCSPPTAGLLAELRAERAANDARRAARAKASSAPPSRHTTPLPPHRRQTPAPEVTYYRPWRPRATP
jgi:hypothetical protein